MGRGIWTRWGRGSCEGWGLAIGDVLRCGVVRGLIRIDRPTLWRADINAVELGDYPTREQAMQRVEERVTADMRAALADWAVFEKRKR